MPARVPDPDKVKPADEAEFAKAVVAAVTDEKIARGRARGTTPVESLTRVDIEELRRAGCTRDDARSYFDAVFGVQMLRRPTGNREVTRVRAVDLLMSDLDSYGAWAGDGT